MSRLSFYLGLFNDMESDAACVRLHIANFWGDLFLLTTAVTVNEHRYPSFENEGSTQAVGSLAWEYAS